MPDNGRTLAQLLDGQSIGEPKQVKTKTYTSGVPQNKVREGDLGFVDVPLVPSTDEDFKEYMSGKRIVIAGILYDSYFRTIGEATEENAFIWNDYFKLIVVKNVLWRQRIISLKESLNRHWWDVTH